MATLEAKDCKKCNTRTVHRLYLDRWECTSCLFNSRETEEELTDSAISLAMAEGDDDDERRLVSPKCTA